ncbi:DNA double-strand break repair nuclease NurA [archaeon]|nr:DNA double-strand break repair nuclease NurA [archaeon]
MELRKLDVVAESLKKDFEAEGKEIILSNKRILLSKDFFYPINETLSEKKIGFVDGGNGEIISASNFSVQLIKTYWSIYTDNKRVMHDSDEFVVLISLKNGRSPFYKVQFFDRKDSFVFPALENNHLIKPGVIGEKVRKIFEIKACNELIGKCEFIVRDGDLEINYYDKEYYEDLFETCREKNIVLAGLSKTSTILCDNGLSAGFNLSKLTKLSKWYYKNDEEIIFVKLHLKSRHVFRLDMYEFSEELIELLSKNSTDLSFPGYPYALIEVDKMARVSRDELDRMKLYLLSKYEKELDPHMASIDAHDRLNVIN